ncbi:MAG: hypothetical protein ACFFDT_27500 [Candidatus Hodarchaeota archaeon]
MGAKERTDAQHIRWLGWASGSPFIIIAGTFLGAVIARDSFGQSYEAIGAITGALIAFLLSLLEFFHLLRSERNN